MFEAIQGARPAIARSVRVLRRACGLDEMTLDDLGARIVRVERTFTVEESRRLTLDAAEALGSDFRDLMAERLAKPWMHLEDSPHKENSGGVFWQAGGGHPHTVFTYRGDYASSRIYAGAALLMMAYASIPEDRAPDRREEDLPVFSNAVWYLGRLLHDEAVLKSATGRDERIAVLTGQLSRILDVLVNFPVIVELEAVISDRIAGGGSLSGKQISQIYGALLGKYYGSGQIGIPPYRAYGWTARSFAFYGPHYASFYEAMTVALVLKRRIDDGDPRAIKAVRDGIGRSRTLYSADVLAEAGIDMGARSTYDAALAEMESVARELERALDGS